MRAVSDAGPLIHLSWIDQLPLLDRLFEEISVPSAVRDEVLASPPGALGLDRIQQAFDAGWLQVTPVKGSVRIPRSIADVLDQGEIEALMLAHHLGADVFLTDDAAARAVAVQRGLAVAGTIGLLTEARDEGLIPAALPLLLELRRLGQWISEDLLQAVKDEEAERST